ncbi:hypothetical protein [Flectobacillus rivi]|uniref:Uncharacterized protein n=1 Tax=Flectobacillus rivi TaxID=2984209 RepID=A0ABT6Z814_9BACT|nr:hypothetical protein [Flectobacillus rivi]MDI9877277.1 hypothetical protein [Flectobacillus rivi]
MIVSEKVTKATGTEAQSDYFRKSGKGNRHKSAKWLFQKKWQKKQAQKHRVIISEKVAKATGTKWLFQKKWLRERAQRHRVEMLKEVVEET